MNLVLLQEKVAVCTKCPELCASRTRTVFGVGDPHARLMIVGEGPGQKEDENGVPFVGPAGLLLNQIITAAGWNREDIYITNTVKCRPPNNRIPTMGEMDNCREYLDGQIELVDPEFILALGGAASNTLVGMPVGKARTAKNLRYKGKMVFCTYHPSYILHQEDEARIKRAKAEVWVDLLELRKAMS